MTDEELVKDAFIFKDITISFDHVNCKCTSMKVIAEVDNWIFIEYKEKLYALDKDADTFALLDTLKD